MNNEQLQVREVREEDTEHIVNYWVGSDMELMEQMGVDIHKLPDRKFWYEMLKEQLEAPIKEKQSYATIWLLNGKQIGHCNVNKIVYGKEAYMHLHVWEQGLRKKGMGRELVKKSLPFFFDNLKLEVLYCEPYALNAAPNRTLEKVGFELEKEYITTPGFLNFEQPVKRWRLLREQYEDISK